LLHERKIQKSRRRPAMEPMTMPAMAPPVRVLASVGSSSLSEELPVVLSVTTTWRRRRWVVVEAAARRRRAAALGRVMGAMVVVVVGLVFWAWFGLRRTESGFR
jgi:hypothetical protein